MNTGSAVQKVNWHQAFAEVALIVAGILIALAVDAWREEKLEREAETNYLEALRQDFETNRERLEATISDHENVIKIGKEVLTLIQGGLTEESSAELLSKIGDLYSFPNWTPVTGTYDDIVNSGRLLYIQNVQLRRELSGFLKTSDRIRRYEELQTATWYDRHAPFVEEFLVLTNLYYGGLNLDQPPESPFSEDLSALETRRFWNLVTEWTGVHVDIIIFARIGIMYCERILELVDSELENRTNRI